MIILNRFFFADVNREKGGFFEMALGRLHITLWTPHYWQVAFRYRQVCLGPLDVCLWERDE